MISQLVGLLLETTLALSAAAILVLLLRRPLRRLVGARAAYAAWLLLPAAGLAVMVPARTVTMTMPEAMPLVSVPIGTVAPANIAAPFDPAPWLIAAWIVGAIGLGLVLARQQSRFRLSMGSLRARGDGSLQAAHADAGPAVIGVWRSHIVLPADFDTRYSEVERELVLRHERAHLLRRDPLANLGAAALRCVYWFNPVLHYAIGRFRFDQELAVDAAVLAQCPEARRSYADAMLKTQLLLDQPPLGCHWQSAHPLKERISMLKQPLPSAARLAAGFALALGLSATTGYVAWASQPETIVMDQAAEVDEVAAHRTITVRGVGADLRDALSQVIASQGLTLVNPELIPAGGDQVEFDFNDTPLSTVLNILLEDVELTAVIRIDGKVMLWKTGQPIAQASATQAAAELNQERRMKPPKYPADAIARGAQGTVVLKVEVDASGKALQSELDVEASTPNIDPQLVEASQAAVANWRFEPGRDKNGKATSGWVSVPVTFTVDEKDAVPAKTSSLPVPPPRMVEASETRGPMPTYNRIMRPKYPAAAVAEKREGKVMLRVLVGVDGLVQQVEVDTSSGSTDLDESAKATVMKWTFNAAHDGHKPVATWVAVPVDFSLDESSPSDAASPDALEEIYVRPKAAQTETKVPAISFGWTNAASGSLGWVTERNPDEQC